MQQELTDKLTGHLKQQRKALEASVADVMALKTVVTDLQHQIAEVCAFACLASRWPCCGMLSFRSHTLIVPPLLRVYRCEVLRSYACLEL